MAHSPTYPLLPFSQLVHEMVRWNPSIYMLGMSMRIVGGANKKDLWHHAFESALLNHPVFQTKIDWRGRQYQASSRNILEGKYHRISLTADGDDLIVNGRVNRILGDGTSLTILMDDINRAYRGEVLPEDDYWGYLKYEEQQKQSKHYAESKFRLENEFADESIPVRPTIDRRLWTFFSPQVGTFISDYTLLRKSIVHFAKEQELTLEGFFSLCAALAIAEYSNTDAAALTWAYKGRERPEEQRVFGSLHRDIPFVIKMKGEGVKAKGELIRQARNQIRQGIAHSDYPYTLTAPYNKRWNYALNVLRVEDEQELIKFLPQPVELLPYPPQKYAYALLDVEIHESFEHLHIIYRYSATHYKESSILRFAALVRKYAEWLIDYIS